MVLTSITCGIKYFIATVQFAYFQITLYIYIYIYISLPPSLLLLILLHRLRSVTRWVVSGSRRSSGVSGKILPRTPCPDITRTPQKYEALLCCENAANGNASAGLSICVVHLVVVACWFASARCCPYMQPQGRQVCVHCLCSQYAASLVIQFVICAFLRGRLRYSRAMQ